MKPIGHTLGPLSCQLLGPAPAPSGKAHQIDFNKSKKINSFLTRMLFFLVNGTCTHLILVI